MEENKTNIQLDFTKLSVVAIDQVRANTWNPKDKDTKEFADIKASIKENGLRGFIVVRENPIENSLYEIIDGEQRWRACKEEGFDKVVIYNEGKVEDKKAQELTLWWQVQVQFNELSLAKLITKMVADFGEIHTPYSEKKLQEMKELASFSFDQYKKTSTTPPMMPEPPKGELLKSFMIQVTEGQYNIIQQALAKAKEIAKNEGAEITDSRALEFVCIEYINSSDTSIN